MGTYLSMLGFRILLPAFHLTPKGRKPTRRAVCHAEACVIPAWGLTSVSSSQVTYPASVIVFIWWFPCAKVSKSSPIHAAWYASKHCQKGRLVPGISKAVSFSGTGKALPQNYYVEAYSALISGYESKNYLCLCASWCKCFSISTSHLFAGPVVRTALVPHHSWATVPPLNS